MAIKFKVFLPIVAFGALYASGMILASVARAADPPTILSITFDDSYKSQFVNAFPVMRKYQLTGTAYVITRDIGDAADDPIWTPLSWSDIKTLQAGGWEIGSHTVSHPHLPALDDKQLANELRYSSMHIAQRLGLAPVSFAAPYGEVDARVRDAIAKVYQNSVSTGDADSGGDRMNLPAHIDPYNILGCA